MLDVVSRRSPRSRAFVLGALTFALVATLASPLRAAPAETPSLTPLIDASSWLNGEPSRASLRGKVVLVDVFTFGCFNCKNVTPELRALNRRTSEGLAIIGIHSPETPYEHEHAAVVSNLRTLGVTWPVAIDNDLALWNAYHVEAWPTQLIFDRQGKLRKTIVGDSQDALVSQTIDALLKERA